MGRECCCLFSHRDVVGEEEEARTEGEELKQNLPVQTLKNENPKA